MTFFWLCAASALAWAKGQLYNFTGQELFQIKSFSVLNDHYRWLAEMLTIKKLSNAIIYNSLHIHLKRMA